MADSVTAPTATILHLQRLSTEDGPGLRTTVFFKGCPLRCTWCHNPESLSPQAQLQWLENRCIGDRACLQVCPSGALKLTPSGMVIDRDACQSCGDCTRACPSGALELLGAHVTLDALLAEVLKDRAYFSTSEGGVTASGGEPALQAQFVSSFFARLQADGIHTALDTCGLCAPDALLHLLPHVDMLLYDVKLMDAEFHRRFTGVSNERILSNLLLVRDWIAAHNGRTRVWIRTPLIPAATATQENLTAIGRFIADGLSDYVERWELLSFNNLCRDKYRRLGMPWAYADTCLLTSEELAELESWAKTSGFDANRILASGATAVVAE